MDELWKNSIDRLESRREAVLAAGGAERIAKQHASGKLTARERMEALFDDGTFVELNGRSLQDVLISAWIRRKSPVTAS